MLSAVEYLRVVRDSGFTVTLNWTAPFTLDISLINPDITYCVDVVSATTSATLHSECGVRDTEFTYLLPPRSWCHQYNVSVTPVNVVGNGSIESIKFFQAHLTGKFLLFFKSLQFE